MGVEHARACLCARGWLRAPSLWSNRELLSAEPAAGYSPTDEVGGSSRSSQAVSSRSSRGCFACWGVDSARVVLWSSRMPAAAVRPRFDIVWFGQQKAKLDQNVFERLNRRDPDERGHYLVMPTAKHQEEIEKAGNKLAFYYKALNADEAKKLKFGRFPAAAIADEIAALHGREGFRTKWVFINEISATLWPAQGEYRQWVIEIAARLHGHHGLIPAVFSPFATLRPNRPAGPDWKRLSEQASIVIEGYLSGQVIRAFRRNAGAACRARYLEMKNSYLQYNVPARKLILAEHFGHTQRGERRTWGRCGVELNDWLAALKARSAAARDVGFGGFASFAWMYNQMHALPADLVRCCDVYDSARLP
jgi:hypothetical protein